MNGGSGIWTQASSLPPLYTALNKLLGAKCCGSQREPSYGISRSLGADKRFEVVAEEGQGPLPEHCLPVQPCSPGNPPSIDRLCRVSWRLLPICFPLITTWSRRHAKTPLRWANMAGMGLEPGFCLKLVPGTMVARSCGKTRAHLTTAEE